MSTNFTDIQEKEIHPMSGYAGLFLNLVLCLASIAGIIIAGIMLEDGILVPFAGVLLGAAILLMIVACIMFAGLKTVGPKEALVLTLFGEYYGTIKDRGFYFVNPFCAAVNPAAKPAAVTSITGNVSYTGGGSRKVSLKTMTLNNDKQKVNDILGNPIIVGAVVIWRVSDPTKAVFNVENYKDYLSIQCDSTIRNIARLYPYDLMDDDLEGDEKTLRGSSQEIADKMKIELQERVIDAGLEVLEVRITHLSYAEEIAAAMLQRQQAVAIIAARQKIVEGAVGMVEMALHKLSENDVVELDDERKAAMVSNLLVVLCGNKEAQPIVNSGSLY